MVRYIDSDIPEDKFDDVTIGKNGVRFSHSIPMGGNTSKQTNMYLRKEDIIEIYNKFIAEPLQSNNRSNDTDNEYEISDAVY